MHTVLVVDDEFGVAEVLEAILQDEGYRVVTAINGRQGLDRARETPPDLILLDLMMPIMGGAAMLEALRADAALAHVPVVVMSSLDEAAVRDSCSGYRAFLRKPFRMAEVLRLLPLLMPPDTLAVGHEPPPG
ncbi:MAG TPA: response regulator [Frateuria sp.]|uniref:response regulator n=1 Tax=Frateuria sp. TaxID=2211372 RepID=UPI002D8108A3|nr:response regulator [Frateuria sp.]HET6803921.1 response regulator [Frateuria sp.]